MLRFSLYLITAFRDHRYVSLVPTRIPPPVLTVLPEKEESQDCVPARLQGGQNEEGASVGL